MHKILIKIENVEIHCTLKNTSTVAEILKVIPINSSANVWGNEIYFDIPVYSQLEKDSLEEVEIGDIAYWPKGPAICLFFGSTPVSTSNKPRAISPVNIIGKVISDIDILRKVKNGGKVEIIKEEETGDRRQESVVSSQ
jgi:hypothetical protein